MVPASTDRGQRRSRLLGGNGGVVASTTSTVLVVGLLAFLILFAPGSAEVRHTFFSLDDMRRALFGDPEHGIFSVAGSIVLNIEMFLIAEVLILILALVIAVIRQLHAPALLPIRLLAVAYTDFFRGVPLILVIYAIGFGLPALNLGGRLHAGSGGLRRRRPRPLLCGLRLGGLPGGHRLGASEPGRGRSFAWV